MPKTPTIKSALNSRSNSRQGSEDGSPLISRMNTPAGDQSTKKAKKSKIPPISLEEIFNQVSTVVASNLNPPPGRIVLTPRSAEVCLKYGVNPEILKIRDIDSFWEAGLDPAVQRMRHEAYVQRRHDLMKQCRSERKRLINAEFDTSLNSAPEAGLTPEMILQQQKEQNSTLIQLEMQRIEKMQKRQEKEIEQMISYEINRAKVQQDMEKRIQESRKKDDLRKKQQEKRLKLMAEERRLRELQKAAIEEAEEETRRRVAQEMFENDKKLAEEKARKAREDKARLQEDELEKKRKHEEHKQQLQQYFAEEQMQLRQRLDKMQEAEKKKQDAILRKQEELAEALRSKRAVVEQRIEHNMSVAQMIEEKRKNDFLEKQDHFERIRTEHLARQEEERRLHAQELLLQEQRRRMILLQQRKEEEKKAEKMLEKFEEEEQHVQEVFVVRKKEHELLTEKKTLRTQMKLENVERVMRVNEYRRMNTLKKIEDSDSRIKSMVNQKQSLASERRKAAAQSRLQKESLMKVMEELKTNATKANKIITKAMTSDVPLTELIMPKRSNSASKKMKSSKTTSELLGLGRESRSGGVNGTGDMSSSVAGFSVSGDGPPPKPYVSPYLSTDQGGDA